MSFDDGNPVTERPIVAFDFDGTLTVRDSFLAFLAWRAGRRRYAAGLRRLSPAALAYLGHKDRGQLKAEAVRVFLAGVPKIQLEAEARAFAEAAAPRLLRPDAVKVWRRWQADGARLAIVTASPSILVAPFARGLAAEVLLGTEIAFDEQGLVSGALASENCRGQEKVRRLRETFGPDVRLAAAYGDTAGDREMLAIAEAPGYRVFHGRPGKRRS
jgi:phosphatidylglycerophosphatase C